MPRFVSFNINGLRARPHQLEAIRDIIAPDVIGLQETKVHDDAFPLQSVQQLGYHVEFWAKISLWCGVIITTKPIFCTKGFPTDSDDAQRRFIHARYDFNGKYIDVLNGYFPQGENRKAWNQISDEAQILCRFNRLYLAA